MQPAQQIFRRCCHCSALVSHWEPSSGSTFAGITIWSDGIAEGPMLCHPDVEGRRCPSCKRAVWTRSLTRVRSRGEDVDHDRCAVVLLAIGPNALAVNRAIRTAIPMSVRDAHVVIHDAPIPLSLRSSAPELVAALAEAGADAVDMTRPGARTRFELEPLDSAGYAELLATEHHEIEIRLEWWRFDNEPYRGDRAWHRYADRPADVQANALRLLELLRSGDDRLLAAELARQLERNDDAVALVETMSDEPAIALADLARARRPELARLIVSES